MGCTKKGGGGFPALPQTSQMGKIYSKTESEGPEMSQNCLTQLDTHPRKHPEEQEGHNTN